MPIIFSGSLGQEPTNKINYDNNGMFQMDMLYISQDGINSIMFYYEEYGDKIISHIPEEYIEEFYKKIKKD